MVLEIASGHIYLQILGSPDGVGFHYLRGWGEWEGPLPPSIIFEIMDLEIPHLEKIKAKKLILLLYHKSLVERGN